MTSRWSKRRKLNKSVADYLNLFESSTSYNLHDNQGNKLSTCKFKSSDTNAEESECSIETEANVVSDQDVDRCDTDCAVCNDINCMCVSKTNCRESTAEQLTVDGVELVVDETILDVCPDVRIMSDEELDLSKYLSSSDFDSFVSPCSSHEESEEVIADASVSSDNCLCEDLAKWAVDNAITHAALKSLLKLLSSKVADLPTDPRTLLKTKTSQEIRKVDDGQYCHIGIENGLRDKLALLDLVSVTKCSSINLQVNVDGLPLFKSSSMQLWPILGRIQNSLQFTSSPIMGEPFIIGLYQGTSKPANVELFMQEFVNEALKLQLSGIAHCDKFYAFCISSVVCDMPARSFIKCVKGHGAYSGCDRCTQHGVYEGKVTFPDCYAPLRSDESFARMTDINHHIKISPLAQLSIGMVQDFPLDYMHLVCLGVMRKLVALWLCGPLKTRLGRNSIAEINARLLSYRNFIPSEFKRKPRSLSEYERWKATEYRQLLLYTGIVCLVSILPPQLYDNFMLLSVAIKILLTPSLCQDYCDYSHELLVMFVEHFGKLYGMDKITYNVHGLVHLRDDAKRYGALDSVSAFPFENFLGQLKRLVRKPNHPLQQIVRRISEKRSSGSHNFEDVDRVSMQSHKFDGSVLAGLQVSSHYKQIGIKEFVVKLSDADRYVQLLTGDIVHVDGIVKDIQNRAYIVYRVFRDESNVFTYPLASSDIGILRFNRLGTRHRVVHVSHVRNKCIVLPVKKHYVSFPMNHLYET